MKILQILTVGLLLTLHATLDLKAMTNSNPSDQSLGTLNNKSDDIVTVNFYKKKPTSQNIKTTKLKTVTIKSGQSYAIPSTAKFITIKKSGQPKSSLEINEGLPKNVSFDIHNAYTCSPINKKNPDGTSILLNSTNQTLLANFFALSKNPDIPHQLLNSNNIAPKTSVTIPTHTDTIDIILLTHAVAGIGEVGSSSYEITNNKLTVNGPFA